MGLGMDSDVVTDWRQKLKILLFANSRSGSTYIANGLHQCLMQTVDKDAQVELTPSPFSTFHNYPNYVLRLFPRHIKSFIEIVNDVIPDDAIKIFLYRNDIEDQLLSKIIMDITDTANIKKIEHAPVLKELFYNHNEHIKIIRARIRDNVWSKRILYNLFEWDHVIAYEDLQGPDKDFKFLFPNYDETWNLEKKMYTKQQKRDALVNYDSFLKHFEEELDRYKSKPWFMEN